MWIAPVIAFAALFYLALSRPAALAVAAPILGLWFASPAIAWWISRPLARRAARLTADQTVFLRKLSRKTWAFFETFVGPEDHWLPPDNYQEHPVAVVAHRTSPTNMGLALLANLSAYDFGYIPAGQLIERTANAFRTMEALERHRGHFYNWYDTLSLKPLQPTVHLDGGQREPRGHLLTLRPGLLALPDQKILGARLFEGSATHSRFSWTLRRGPPLRPSSLNFRRIWRPRCDSRPTTLTAARLCLDRLAASAAEVDRQPRCWPQSPESEAKWWARAFARQCQDALDELTFLAPWILLPTSPNRLSDFRGIDEIPTLRELARL